MFYEKFPLVKIVEIRKAQILPLSLKVVIYSVAATISTLDNITIKFEGRNL